MEKTSKLKCAVTGALAGAANGFFGAGGGMFVIPLFTRWVKLDEQKTYASSIAVILPLCIVSAVVYLARDGVNFMDALPYLIGGIAGGFAGGKIFKKIPTKVLRKAFAIILVVGGARGLFK